HQRASHFHQRVDRSVRHDVVEAPATSRTPCTILVTASGLLMWAITGKSLRRFLDTSRSPSGIMGHADKPKPRLQGAQLSRILVVRHQLNVVRRNAPKRFVFGTFDRLAFVGLYRIVPGIVDTLAIVRPETVVCWHRPGFRSFWRWKSRRSG